MTVKDNLKEGRDLKKQRAIYRGHGYYQALSPDFQMMMRGGKSGTQESLHPNFYTDAYQL